MGSKKPLFLALGSIVFFILALDGRLHWDEPAYLYTGAYLNIDQIFKGQFQPSGIDGFYLSRILHILFIYLASNLLGPGLTTFFVLSIIYFSFLVAFSLTSYLILSELLPNNRRIGIAGILGSFIPIYLYFAFKTMPEIPALLLASLAVLGLQRSLNRQASVLWLLLTAVSLAGTALTKNTLVLLYISFAISLILVNQRRYPRYKIIKNSVISGVGSLFLFFAFLYFANISLQDYLGPAADLFAVQEPFVSLILHSALEGGVFFVFLPLAFLTNNKRHSLFFTTWFLLATVPQLFLLPKIEARYLAPNLLAFFGLIALSVDGLWSRIITLWRRNQLLVGSAASVVVSLTLLSNVIALAIMSHEVRVDQLYQVMNQLDRTFGKNNYVILTPWSYTDFHYLRFVYPEKEIYSVYSVSKLSDEESFTNKYTRMENSFYGSEIIRSFEKLNALNKPIVYLGFEENFSVANLRTIARIIPGVNIDSQFDKMTFLKQISLSWMWGNSQIKLSEIIRRGHYVVYNVDTKTRTLPIQKH